MRLSGGSRVSPTILFIIFLEMDNLSFKGTLYILLLFVVGIAYELLKAVILMMFWNYVITEIFDTGAVTFLQALLVYIASKIIIGVLRK